MTNFVANGIEVYFHWTKAINTWGSERHNPAASTFNNTSFPLALELGYQ